MRLTAKLIAGLLGVIILFLIVDGFIRVRRATRFYRQDIDRDSRMLGLALRPLVEEAWRSQGEQHALSVIDRVNQGEQPIQVRWVWFDAEPGDPHYAKVDPNQIRYARTEQALSVEYADESGEHSTLTYIVLQVPTQRPGALELSEDLLPIDEYARGLVWQEITLGVAILLVSAVVVSLLGVTLVGRPLRSLMEKTKQVGEGRFTIPVEIRGRNELGQLAEALNTMGETLAESHETLKAETEARIATIEQLRHVDRLATVGRLASGVAHELGTPLNVVQGRAGQIARSTADKDVTACADIIRNQVNRMTRILRQLLGFARPNKPRKEDSDLRKVVDQATDLLEPLARKKDVQIQWDRPGAPLAAWIDNAMIQQVLMNLIDNAIYAADKGGNVQLRLERERCFPPADLGGTEGDYVKLSVTDDGPGISEENRSHVFDPFFTTKDVGQGTGLGLSIAYGIAREHGGWIDVSSAPGEGSCFSVHLPAEGSV